MFSPQALEFWRSGAGPKALYDAAGRARRAAEKARHERLRIPNMYVFEPLFKVIFIRKVADPCPYEGIKRLGVVSQAVRRACRIGGTCPGAMVQGPGRGWGVCG